MTSAPAQTVAAPEPKQAETTRESRPVSQPAPKPFAIKLKMAIPG